MFQTIANVMMNKTLHLANTGTSVADNFIALVMRPTSGCKMLKLEC